MNWTVIGKPFIFIIDYKGQKKGKIIYMITDRLEWAERRPFNWIEDRLPEPSNKPNFKTHIINCPTLGIFISLEEHIISLLRMEYYEAIKKEEFGLALVLKQFISS